MTYTPIAKGTSDWDVPVNDAFAAQDVRITSNETAVANLNGTTSTHTSQIAANTTNIATNTSNITALQTLTNTLDFQPSDHAIKAWSQDPAGCGSTGSINTSGVIYLSKVILRAAATVSNLYVTVTAAGSGLTAGQNLVGLYTSTGTKLVEGADQTTPFASAGTKTVAITPQNLAAGSYYIAIMSNGTTPATFMRGNGASGSALNIGLANSVGRFLDFGAGQTSLPSSITMASTSQNSAARWVAMS